MDSGLVNKGKDYFRGLNYFRGQNYFQGEKNPAMHNILGCIKWFAGFCCCNVHTSQVASGAGSA